jgi:hypothetical protein
MTAAPGGWAAGDYPRSPALIQPLFTIRTKQVRSRPPPPVAVTRRRAFVRGIPGVQIRGPSGPARPSRIRPAAVAGIDLSAWRPASTVQAGTPVPGPRAGPPPAQALARHPAVRWLRSPAGDRTAYDRPP